MERRFARRVATIAWALGGALAICACGLILDIAPGNPMGADSGLDGSSIVAGDASKRSCQLPWGGSIDDGKSVVAYLAAGTVDAGGCDCPSESRICNGGVLSGSATIERCVLALVESTKTNADCVDAGGEVAAAGTAGCLCRFQGRECPANWSGYDDWRTTVSSSCTSGPTCSCPVCSCTAEGEGWSSHEPDRCDYRYRIPGGNCVTRSCQADITQTGCR